MVGQYSLFAVLAVALIAEVAHAKPPQKIVNGEYANAGDYPFIVSLILNREHICGGTIVTKRHILTAAHCVNNIPPINDLHVITGSIYVSSGGQTHRPIKILYHTEYTNTVTGPNDVAILVLAAAIQFNIYQSPAFAPKSPPATGTIATVVGWGYPSVNHPEPVDRLRKLKMEVLDAVDCQQYSSVPIHPYQLCAFAGNGRGPCHTDSGGPLAVNSELIGVVSYGTPCAKGDPDVFSNVYYYKDWINYLATTT